MAREVVSPVEESGSGDVKRNILSFFKELPVLVALALVIALVIKAFLVQAFYIPSASMEPTLNVGDRVLVNKLTYRFREPARGDIVVFKDPYAEITCPSDAPPDTQLPDECHPSIPQRAWEWVAELFGLPAGSTKDYIKRIVALPGETIEMRDGVVFIEGQAIQFESSSTSGPQPDSFSMPAYTLGDNAYYVLGDNRSNSSDSRVFREIEGDTIVGRAFVLLWPPSRFGGL